MGISEGYARVAAKNKKLRSDYLARYRSAGLPEPAAHDLHADTCYPCTKEGWASHRALLQAENALTDEAAQEVEIGLRWVLIHEAEARIKNEIASGKPVLEPGFRSDEGMILNITPEIALSSQADRIIAWMAILELGLTDYSLYRKIREDAQVQAYQIKNGYKSTKELWMAQAVEFSPAKTSKNKRKK